MNSDEGAKSSDMPPRKDRPDRFIRSVKLTGIQKRYLPNKHYVYMFKVKWSDGTGHIIYRSYSDFFEFHTELVDLFPLEAGLLSGKDRVIPNFPRRRFFERNELRQFARQQQVHFEQYCNQLITMKSPIVKHPFLLLFFQPKFEDIEPPQSLLKKPERVNKLKKIIQQFSRKKRTSRRLTIFDPPPELPQGVIAQQYKALNGFTADLEGQVTFEEGDVLKVVEKNACGWWIAEVPSGQTGWVPGSFLEQLGNVHEYEECINVDGDLYISVQCYTSQNDDELSFEAGVTLMVMQKRMTGWWIARYDGEVGYVPAAYLIKYTNEDYMRVCTPIMRLKAKAATTDVITPLPTRKFSTHTPVPGRKWSILPLPSISDQIQKSPRRTSLVEIRNEEDALERARSMAFHPRTGSRNANNSACSSESETRMAIPEIIITSPDHDVDPDETVQVHASFENEESNMADNNADERTEESNMSDNTSGDEADSMMAAYFDAGSWQKIVTKDTNIKQSTPNNKLSSKTSPFGTTAGSVEPDKNSVKEAINNQDWASFGNASMDRKVAKFKLTHDNALAKKVILGLSSASDSDISKTSTVKSERPFCSAGSIFDKLSTMGLAGSLCNLEESVGSAILFDKMMSSSNMKTWSTRACAGSAPTLRIDTKSSPQQRREPFQVLACKDTKQDIETTFDLGVEFGWYGASFPTQSPAISLCNHTPFALTPKRLGLVTNREDSPLGAYQANVFSEEDNSVFLHDPNPIKLFSTKRNPRLQGKFIDTPRTAGQLNLDWVIFKDGSVDLRSPRENQPNCRTEVVPSLHTHDAEVQHCPDVLGGRSIAPPDQPQTREPTLNSGNQSAIASLVGALQGLTDALAKGIPGPTRILVKDVSQQCNMVPLGHVTDDDDDDYDYYYDDNEGDDDYKDSIVHV